jgi:hypothetical protein
MNDIGNTWLSKITIAITLLYCLQWQQWMSCSEQLHNLDYAEGSALHAYGHIAEEMRR